MLHDIMTLTTFSLLPRFYCSILLIDFGFLIILSSDFILAFQFVAVHTSNNYSSIEQNQLILKFRTFKMYVCFHKYLLN